MVDIKGSTRSGEVDAVRAVALFGICVVNVPFLAQPLDSLLARATRIDAVAQFAVEWLFQGKFFIMFSFMFGWAVISQAERNPDRANTSSRYLRRLLGLAVLGIAHATLVFFGDILLLYALIGLALLPLQDAAPAKLMRVALYSLVGAAFSFALLGVLVAEVGGSPNASAAIAAYRGSFFDAFHQRLNHDWPIAFAFVCLFNGPLAFAAFCAGAAAAKVKLFEPGNLHFARARRSLPFLFVGGLAINMFYALAIDGAFGQGVWSLLGLMALAIGSPLLGCAYLVAIVELYRRGWFSPAMLASGAMSLTCYVLEGAVAGIIFNGYGFGLYGSQGPFACIVWALVVFAITHGLCQVWHARFGTGPLERVLRAIIGGRRT